MQSRQPNTEDLTMKIERTVVIGTLSVIVGLGVVGVSPAFAGESSALPVCPTSGVFDN